MAITLISRINAEEYRLNRKPKILISDGIEYYLTEAGVLFPAEKFSYVFTLDENRIHFNRFEAEKLFDFSEVM